MGNPSKVHENCGGGCPMATHFSDTTGPGWSVCSENQYTSSGFVSIKKKNIVYKHNTTTPFLKRFEIFILLNEFDSNDYNLSNIRNFFYNFVRMLCQMPEFVNLR